MLAASAKYREPELGSSAFGATNAAYGSATRSPVLRSLKTQDVPSATKMIAEYQPSSWLKVQVDTANAEDLTGREIDEACRTLARQLKNDFPGRK